MAKKPYVHSNFERRDDDHYPTIDPRCIDALLDCVAISQPVADCCARNGSAIVDQLRSKNRTAFCVSDAFSDFNTQWIVTNPPYKKGEVDKIIWRQIKNLEEKRAVGLAVLLRNNFDFAKSRYDMFTHDYYDGQIHMMFRPWWSDEHEQSPIHNFVWHIWSWKSESYDLPVVHYWKENNI